MVTHRRSVTFSVILLVPMLRIVTFSFVSVVLAILAFVCCWNPNQPVALTEFTDDAFGTHGVWQLANEYDGDLSLVYSDITSKSKSSVLKPVRLRFSRGSVVGDDQKYLLTIDDGNDNSESRFYGRVVKYLPTVAELSEINDPRELERIFGEPEVYPDSWNVDGENTMVSTWWICTATGKQIRAVSIVANVTNLESGPIVSGRTIREAVCAKIQN